MMMMMESSWSIIMSELAFLVNDWWAAALTRRPSPNCHWPKGASQLKATYKAGTFSWNTEMPEIVSLHFKCHSTPNYVGFALTAFVCSRSKVRCGWDHKIKKELVTKFWQIFTCSPFGDIVLDGLHLKYFISQITELPLTWTDKSTVPGRWGLAGKGWSRGISCCLLHFFQLVIRRQTSYYELTTLLTRIQSTQAKARVHKKSW